ncbi:MAG: protein-glutamate O-methyltransferase CheR [Rhodobacteraceae bacterium]|nr:protein-glutamate O-methyltransferase CheR [Paracoccaceae bacterium]
MDKVQMHALFAFLKTSCGLIVNEDKLYLVNSRLQPITEKYQCKTIAELVMRLTTSRNEDLKRDIIEAMTTNETSFFRDVTPFDHFKNHVIEKLLDRRRTKRSIRILCAAASSGQEPYSLAMIMSENAGKLSGWRTDIIGVDIDTKILKRAEEGIYTSFEVQRGLPIQLLVKYFDKQTSQNWQVKPQIRSMVRFQKKNLLEPIRDLGQFDVIFCRNVLIYFDIPTKRVVLERLADQLAPDGFLFLGGAETVFDITTRFVAAPGFRGMYVPTQGGAKPGAGVA